MLRQSQQPIIHRAIVTSSVFDLYLEIDNNYISRKQQRFPSFEMELIKAFL